MDIVNIISISFSIILGITSCKQIDRSELSDLNISIINSEPSIIFEFSFKVDTSFYIDYKVFSKECYSKPTSSIVASMNDFRFDHSALIVENESGEFCNYSSIRNCEEYSGEMINCMGDWLRKISLKKGEVFRDTIKIDCVDDLKINSFDKKIRLHYLGIEGESLFGDHYDSMIVRSNWFAI